MSLRAVSARSMTGISIGGNVNDFNERLGALFERLGRRVKAVLATSACDEVSARMMSFVLLDGAFFFQTDRTFKKARQIAANPHVAICVDNVQIEGVCREVGRPLEHEVFASAFRELYPSSFDAYSARDDERVFEVRPTFIQVWSYVDGKPRIERFFCDDRRCEELSY